MTEELTLENLMEFLGILRKGNIRYRLDRDMAMDSLIGGKLPGVGLLSMRIRVVDLVKEYLTQQGFDEDQVRDIWHAVRTGNEPDRSLSDDVIGAISLRYSGNIDAAVKVMK
jgi:hypothetical protein